MQITIVAKDASELKLKIKDLADVFLGPITVTTEAQDPAQTSFPADILAPAKGKPGRKRAEAPPVPQEEPAPISIEEIVIPTPQVSAPLETAAKFTKDAAKMALELLNEKKGLEVARAILSKYNCQRLSELKEEQYGEFIKSCEEKVNEKPKDQTQAS